MYFKKELPGRTMEFTFDLSQTRVIARRQKTSTTGGLASSASGGGGGTMTSSIVSNYSAHLSSLMASTSWAGYGSHSIGSSSQLASAAVGKGLCYIEVVRAYVLSLLAILFLFFKGRCQFALLVLTLILPQILTSPGPSSKPYFFHQN